MPPDFGTTSELSMRGSVKASKRLRHTKKLWHWIPPMRTIRVRWRRSSRAKRSSDAGAWRLGLPHDLRATARHGLTLFSEAQFRFLLVHAAHAADTFVESRDVSSAADPVAHA